MTAENYNMRKSVLLPFVGASLILLGLALWGISTIHYGTLDELIKSQQKAVSTQFNHELRDKAELMSELANQIMLDDQINEAWTNRDRNKLNKISQPYLVRFKNNYQVSHLYFIKKDSTCFLRAHRPDSHSDKIKRFVLERAIKSGLVESGIELGKYGTFTLRVSIPWIVNDSIIGYLELGEEVDGIFASIAEFTGVGVLVTIDKRFLDREKWEKGIKMLGHDWQWESIPYCAVVGQTVDFLPRDLKNHTHSINSDDEHESFSIDNNGATYNCIGVILSDAGKRQVGHLYILQDISSFAYDFWLKFWLTLIIGVMVIGFTTAFLDNYIQKIQSELDKGERAAFEVQQQNKKLKEIRQLNIKLTQVQHLARIGYWELSLDGRQIWASEEAFDIYNLKGDNPIIPVSRIMKLVQSEDRSEVFKSLKQILNGDPKPGFDFRLAPRNGLGERVIYAQAKLITAPDGTPIKVEGFLQDITDNIKTEVQKHQLAEKIKRADRMNSLGLMAGGVAHDLNNMLGPIVGYPELLLRKMPKDSPYRKQIERIGSAATDAANVVRDLLTLARRGRYEMSPVNLNSIVEKYLQSANYIDLKNNNSDIDISINLCDKLGMINGSPSHLGQVIMNLIVNAFDAMPTGGKLIISTERAKLDKLKSGFSNIYNKEYCLLRVEDTGMGIPKDVIDRIFEPYFSKKKMGRSGSGLGLAVVYGIIKDHNGYYDVISEEGKFTEIILYFPLFSEQVAITQDDEADVGGVETILVVDDTDVQLEVSKTLLSSQGYKVHTAISGTEAIEFIKSNQVDLVLLDMVMENGFDGLDTYREILKIRPGQKTIMVSGATVNERFLMAQELGVKQLLRKPFTLKEVNRVIRDELDNQPAASNT